MAFDCCSIEAVGSDRCSVEAVASRCCLEGMAVNKNNRVSVEGTYCRASGANMCYPASAGDKKWEVEQFE
jgi:hypothetical protein